MSIIIFIQIFGGWTKNVTHYYYWRTLSEVSVYCFMVLEYLSYIKHEEYMSNKGGFGCGSTRFKL